MERFFNTAGPVNCDDHYCLPPLTRFDLDEVMRFIGQKKYFVLYAPRQTGKTSCLLALMEYLNVAGDFRALYINVEIGQAARENVDAAMRAILGQIAGEVGRILGDRSLVPVFPDLLNAYGGHGALNEILAIWWEEKIFQKSETFGEHDIHVWGM